MAKFDFCVVLACSNEKYPQTSGEMIPLKIRLNSSFGRHMIFHCDHCDGNAFPGRIEYSQVVPGQQALLLLKLGDVMDMLALSLSAER